MIGSAFRLRCVRSVKITQYLFRGGLGHRRNILGKCFLAERSVKAVPRREFQGHGLGSKLFRLELKEL